MSSELEEMPFEMESEIPSEIEFGIPSEIPPEIPPIPLEIPLIPSRGLKTRKEYAKWACEHDFRDFRNRYFRILNHPVYLCKPHVGKKVYYQHEDYEENEWGEIGSALASGGNSQRKKDIKIEWRELIPKNRTKKH